MYSFTLNAIGNLAKTPELTTKDDMPYVRFCLVGNDYNGRDDEGVPREIATSIYFVAFGPLAEAIAGNARKGDQMILNAQIRANNWTDKQGEIQYDYSYIVKGFRFGAPGKVKREEFMHREASEVALQVKL